MDYTELVKSLRYCASGDDPCGKCERVNTVACEPVLMIEAADAIEELQKDLERSKEYETFWEEKANEALKKLQVAVASKPRWIPVTERLPEEPGAYLVCRQWDYGYGVHTSMAVESYTDNLNKVDKYAFPGKENKRPGWYDYDSEYGYYETGRDITHWMPLPTQPKEETE